MANSNSKASKASRIKTAAAWNKKNRASGKIKQFNVTVTDEESINILNRIRITKIAFLRKALKILDENGEIK